MLPSKEDLNQSCIEPIDSPVLITLPFKDQKSADSVRKQYNCITKCNLSLTIVYLIAFDNGDMSSPKRHVFNIATLNSKKG